MKRRALGLLEVIILLTYSLMCTACGQGAREETTANAQNTGSDVTETEITNTDDKGNLSSDVDLEGNHTKGNEREVNQNGKESHGVNKLSLYINHKELGKRVKSDGYTAPWIMGKDIVSFETYATEDESLTLAGSDFKRVWESYWNSYPNHEICKLGYTIDFILKDGTKIHQTITGLDDVFGYRDYLECYLYDDVNQIQGNWYSHLLDTQVTDQTVMTSIKLTAGSMIDQVGDKIKLTAFVYSSQEDFDAAGDYRGSVSYTVIVKNQ